MDKNEPTAVREPGASVSSSSGNTDTAITLTERQMHDNVRRSLEGLGMPQPTDGDNIQAHVGATEDDTVFHDAEAREDIEDLHWMRDIGESVLLPHQSGKESHSPWRGAAAVVPGPG